ncbi:glycoside hydrolase family 65 protein, partial [Lactococcus lactis subsp. lactis]|nr:glycoside hydrolase family 65 protein [Lactococcus lactis subsp. lactis]
VRNEDSNYDEKFWTVKNLDNTATGSFIVTETIPNPFGVEQFTVAAKQSFAGDFTRVKQETRESSVLDVYEAKLIENAPLTFIKNVLVVTSRDIEPSNLTKVLSNLTLEISKKTYHEFYKEQEIAWKKRWEIADVQIDGSAEAQQ